MKPWKVALVATASTSGIFLMVLLMIRWCSRPGRAVHDHRPKPQENIRRPARLHTDSPKELIDVAFTSRERSSKVSKSGYFMRPFEWKKYPNQMADAIDRGWTAFALSYASVPSGPSMSPIPWKLCSTKGPSDEAFLPEVTWGMAGPEAELVQLIRLNPGMSFQESLLFSVQTLQSALPLPGPSIGQSSFPQEAYFEISILLEGTQKKNWFSFNGYVEDSRKKLIAKNTPSSSIIECSTVVSKHRNFSVDDFESEADSEYKGELRKLIQKRGHQIDPAKKDASNHMQSNGETTEQNENQVVAVGLTAKGAPSFYLPGTYWGSVGFQSNGKILLNGTPCKRDSPKSAVEKKSETTTVNTTLGCGFYPPSQKIFFTMNGELVAEVLGTNSEFSQPLYAAVGSNYDATVMVNFGQGLFVYAPANEQRVADPSCRIPHRKNVKARDFSPDLFSLKMVGLPLPEEFDSTTSEQAQHSHAISVADSDFFEIALEGAALQ